MNKRLLVDFLRRGFYELLILSGVYLFCFVPISSWTWAEGRTIWAAVLLCGAPTVFALASLPGLHPVAEVQFHRLVLPIKRSEIVNTLWLCRTILPASLLAALFTLAVPLGFNTYFLATMPQFLSLHLFLAYFGGLSLLFCVASGAISDRFGLPIMMYVLGLAFPVAYFLWLSDLQRILGSAFTAPLLIALLAAVLYRMAHVRLACNENQSTGPTQTSQRWKPGGILGSGFRRLAADLFSQLLFTICVMGGALILLEIWSNFKGPGKSDEDALDILLVLAPIISLLHYADVPRNVALVRILRILPLSAGTLAARILAITAGAQTLAFLVLSLCLIGYFGAGRGLNALLWLLASAALMIPVIPLALRFKGFTGNILKLGCLAAVLLVILSLSDEIFVDGSLLHTSFTIVVAITIVLLTWWLMKAVLTNSYQTYQERPHRTLERVAKPST